MRVCVCVGERACVRVFFLSDEVTVRDRAAGRACHCQSLFWLLFCFLPEEEKVLHGDQQPLGVIRACLSVYLCTFTYLRVKRVFLSARVCLQTYELMSLFSKSEPAGKNH